MMGSRKSQQWGVVAAIVTTVAAIDNAATVATSAVAATPHSALFRGRIIFGQLLNSSVTTIAVEARTRWTTPEEEGDELPAIDLIDGRSALEPRDFCSHSILPVSLSNARTVSSLLPVATKASPPAVMPSRAFGP